MLFRSPIDQRGSHPVSDPALPHTELVVNGMPSLMLFVDSKPLLSRKMFQKLDLSPKFIVNLTAGKLVIVCSLTILLCFMQVKYEPSRGREGGRTSSLVCLVWLTDALGRLRPPAYLWRGKAPREERPCFVCSPAL